MRASRLVRALLLLAAISAPAVAAVRIRSVSINAGYFYRPYAWGYYGPYWSPFWAYAPLYYPDFYYPYLTPYGLYGGQGVLGEVKIDSPSKTAEVYVNGGYAGEAGKLKTIWLEPGAYDLEVKGPGGTFAKRIYVLSGKTLRLQARLAREEKR